MFEAPELELPDVRVFYQPILDVSRGIAAGYQAITMPIENIPASRLSHPEIHRHVVATSVRVALAAASRLPANTFISITIPIGLVDDRLIHRILSAHGDLSGIVLDITDFVTELDASTENSLDDYRRAGVLIAVGGRDDAQPELGGIVKLRPAIIRLGSPWIRDLDQHPSRRSALEITGRLASQLDAWILAEDVRSAAELCALAELKVPLVQGPVVGAAQPTWSAIADHARTVLPPVAEQADGVLRDLLQQAYTTQHLAAAQAVLPDASGYEYVVVIDEHSRPISLLTQGVIGRWDPIQVMTVNVDTPVRDTVNRMLTRPRPVRFSPIACTDAAGRFLGILRIERLMEHLASAPE